MTKAERKGVVKVFYDAAELIEIGEKDYCCNAIKTTGSRYSDSAGSYFNDLFRNRSWALDGDSLYLWTEEIPENPHIPEVRSRRVMLFLWAALMVETGEYERIFQ